MSASSAFATRRRMKEEGIVTEIVDLGEIAKTPLTASQRAQLGALTDGVADIGDIPEAPAENWALAERDKFYKPRKDAISLRLDMDVLAWLRRYGPGYQTKINAILREKMLSETESRA